LKFNSLYTIPITPGDIQISKNEVLRLLGYEHTKIESHLDELIDENIQKAASLLEPKAGIVFKKISRLDKREGIIYLEKEILQVGKIISSQLTNSESAALFQCTIGNTLELYANEMFRQGDSLEGYIVNLSGSEAAESAAEFIHREIGKIAAEDHLKITNRFSPGYCNWNVEEQFRLFSFFPDGCCGISLTDSALMNPIKSVSGMVGIGKEVAFKEYNCSMCDDEHCIYRKKSKQ